MSKVAEIRDQEVDDFGEVIELNAEEIAVIAGGPEVINDQGPW